MTIPHQGLADPALARRLSWRSHIERAIGNAAKTLSLVMRDVKTKHPGIGEMAYITLVRPQLECAVPYVILIQKTSIDRLRKRSVELPDGFPVTMKGWQVYRTLLQFG